MGIAVWGVVDKFSRMELALWAMPNARDRDLIPGPFLRLVKEQGGMCNFTIYILLNDLSRYLGMPLTVTSDKGTEVGRLISLVTAMRFVHQLLHNITLILY